MPAQSKKANKYAPSTWGKEILLDLEVPSGQLCLVRRPGVAGLIKAGILDSLDSLTGLVQSEHIDRVAKGEGAKITADDISNLANNKDKLAKALALADKVTEYVVVQPSVLRPVVRDEKGNPKLDDRGEEIELADVDRELGQIYTDVVDLMDKMFIFQFVVGGVTDLETFRKEFDESLAGLATFTGASGPA